MLQNLKPFPLAVAVYLALVSPDSIANEAMRLYQQDRQTEEDERQRQRLRQLQRNRTIAEPAPATATPFASPATTSRCLASSGLRIGGNQRISLEIISLALATVASDCIDDQQVNRLLKTITDLYLREGYIGARLVTGFIDAYKGPASETDKADRTADLGVLRTGGHDTRQSLPSSVEQGLN